MRSQKPRREWYPTRICYCSDCSCRFRDAGPCPSETPSNLDELFKRRRGRQLYGSRERTC